MHGLKSGTVRLEWKYLLVCFCFCFFFFQLDFVKYFAFLYYLFTMK